MALHVRWFDVPGSPSGHNVSADYCQRAIAPMEEKIESRLAKLNGVANRLYDRWVEGLPR